MAVSDKLTYLNTTKGLIKDSINLTGANITSNDTFRSYATKLKNGLVGIINNGIDTLYDNFPKVTAEGTEIALNNTYEAPIKLNVVKGDTQQEGTPTPDTPQEVKVVTGLQNVEVIGKNLFDKTATTTAGMINEEGIIGGSAGEYHTTDFISIKPNTNYIMSGSAIVGGAPSRCYYDKNKNFISGIRHNNNNPFSNTSPSNAYYMRESIGIASIDSIQIEEGNVATTYKPYSKSEYEVNLGTLELCKINNYQDTLQKSSGKNLFDEVYPNLSSTLQYMPIYVGEGTFTMSSNTPDNVSGASIFLLAGNVSTGASTSTNGVYLNHSITQTSVNGYLTIAYRNYENINNYNTQLEEGTSSTEYEPYGKVWYKKQMIRKIQLNVSDMNNSENYPGWNNAPYISNDYSNTNTYLNDVTKWKSNISANNSAVSINTRNNANIMYLNKNVFNLTQTEWKTNYPNLTFVIYYYLQIPTYELITNDTLINQLEGIKSKEDSTNITISGNLPMIINASALEKE